MSEMGPNQPGGDVKTPGAAEIGEVAVANSTDGTELAYAPVLIDPATGKTTFITTQQLANHYIEQNRDFIFTSNGLDTGAIRGKIGVTNVGLFRVRLGSGGNVIVITANEAQAEILKKLILSGIPSGATQAGAGAGADEVWKTSGHATLPDNILMIGI
jgi:hypothetical protein